MVQSRGLGFGHAQWAMARTTVRHWRWRNEKPRQKAGAQYMPGAICGTCPQRIGVFLPHSRLALKAITQEMHAISGLLGIA
jgi:hypothetical protein